jgi:polyketide cyclase/dehydrase/lipid transport protein
VRHVELGPVRRTREDAVWNLVLHARCEFADADFAWRFWTDVGNWPVVDPAIDHVCVDPAFVEGARGTTVTTGGTRVEWRIREVAVPRRAQIEFPVPGSALRISWVFRPRSTVGCTMTQTMELSGERAAEYEAIVAPSMERSAPEGLRRLAAAIDEAYNRAADG